jgi:2-hydroxychromene-2-carboxylate isomerase
MKADWFFDIISPFAYLQNEQFDKFPNDLEIRMIPILFGAILDRVGTKGPAEVANKRIFTYRIAQFRALELGIPFKMPPAHPFNPLKGLRLIIALGQTASVIRTVFRFLWRDGKDFNTAEGWTELCDLVGIAPDDPRMSSDLVKAALRDNTERALSLGVWGVPTFYSNGELFWGEDSTGLFLAHLQDPQMFAKGEWARISALPVAIQRKAL